MKPSLLSFFMLFCVCLFPARSSIAAEKSETENAARSQTAQLMALTGDSDFADQRAAWDRTYGRSGYVFGKTASALLQANVDLLPKGRALDIATGEGRNAVFLAKKGFQVVGVDISSVGLGKAKRLAAENGVKIQTLNADLNKYRIKPRAYAVILNFYYLQRNLIPEIKAGLQKGGVVVFESNTVAQLKLAADGRTWAKDELLNPGELKKDFSDFEILSYTESNDGKNAYASLVARKK